MQFLTLIVFFEHFAEVNTFVISIVSKKIYQNPIKARTNFPKDAIQVYLVTKVGRKHTFSGVFSILYPNQT